MCMNAFKYFEAVGNGVQPVKFMLQQFPKLTLSITYRHIARVATNPKNLEYSGISPNMEKSRNSWNSMQPQGKIVTNRVFLVCHSNICVKQLLSG